MCSDVIRLQKTASWLGDCGCGSLSFFNNIRLGKVASLLVSCLWGGLSYFNATHFWGIASLFVDCVWGGLKVACGRFLFLYHPLWGSLLASCVCGLFGNGRRPDFFFFLPSNSLTHSYARSIFSYL